MGYFFGIRHSILRQLIFIIAGASILSALISTIGHYFFTEKLIDDSIKKQMKFSLNLSTDYLENKYSEELRYDLNLLNSSTEVNRLLTSSKNEYFIHQQNVEKLFLSFSINREDIYHDIRLINVAGKELALIRDKKRVRKLETVVSSLPTPSNLMIGELFLKLKESPAGTITFSRPAFENGKIYFSAGIAKRDPDIDGFGGAIIITFTLEKFKEYLNNFKVFDSSVVWLFTHSGESIYSVKEKNTINPFPYVYEKKPQPSELIIYKSGKLEKDSIQSIIQTVIILPPEARKSLLKNLTLITFIILTSITIIGFTIAVLMAKSIVSPISTLTKLSQKVAAGNFDVQIPVKGHNEIASLSQSFNMMVEELEEQSYELTLLANEDTLTRLPNRRRFEETLNKAIKHCKRSESSIALLYIDLDQFKHTNDTFGHPAGDKLIQDVASRLQRTVRETDIVARLGGDEFAIILDPHKTIEFTESVAKKILDELSKPFDIENHKIFSGGSIGISLYPTHGDNATDIVKNADTAMYHAKKLGRNNYQFYSKSMSHESNEKVILGSLIRNAINKNNLAIHYQPKVCLKTKRMVGAEALLRWNDSSTNISTVKLISIAEASGFSDKIDIWVINAVFKQIQKWQTSDIEILPISINISGKMLEQKKIISILEDAFDKYSIQPKLIEIEITENHLIENYVQARKTLNALHKMGIRLAIDDFGTGYSSLSYLKNIQADTLKIDRKFVVNTLKNDSDKAIATVIVQLASLLNMQIVVEGIETEDQANFFGKLGADSAQGYYFSKALPGDSYIKKIKTTF